MGGGLILWRRREAPFFASPDEKAITCGISGRFQPLSPAKGQIIHLLLTRLPLYTLSEESFNRATCMYEACRQRSF